MESGFIRPCTPIELQDEVSLALEPLQIISKDRIGMIGNDATISQQPEIQIRPRE